MNCGDGLGAFQVEQIRQTLDDQAQFDLVEQVFGISSPTRNTYVKYQLVIMDSCAGQYPSSPLHLVQLADMARVIFAVKSTLEDLEKRYRITETWKTNSGKLNNVFARRYARLLFELSWDTPFGVGKSEQSFEQDIARKLDELLLVSILSRSSNPLTNRKQLNAELVRPQSGRLSRLYSQTLQSNEIAARSVIEYHESAEARRAPHFLETAVSILRGDLDFLGRFAVPPTPPQSLSPSAAALAGQFATDSNLSALLEESGHVWVGGTLVYVDTERLDVLERMEVEFGTDNCYYARGVFDGPEGMDASGSNIDESYVILVARRPTESGDVEDAIAISSIAGRNATFYVRGDVSQEHWTKVLTGSKIRAQIGGARRLKFVANAHMDEYEAMHEKLSHLSSCDAADFANVLKNLRYNDLFGYELV